MWFWGNTTSSLLLYNPAPGHPYHGADKLKKHLIVAGFHMLGMDNFISVLKSNEENVFLAPRLAAKAQRHPRANETAEGTGATKTILKRNSFVIFQAVPEARKANHDLWTPGDGEAEPI